MDNMSVKASLVAVHINIIDNTTNTITSKTTSTTTTDGYNTQLSKHSNH